MTERDLYLLLKEAHEKGLTEVRLKVNLPILFGKATLEDRAVGQGPIGSFGAELQRFDHGEGWFKSEMYTDDSTGRTMGESMRLALDRVKEKDT